MSFGRKTLLAASVLLLAGCAQGGPNIVSRFDTGAIFAPGGAQAPEGEPAISSRSQISLL